MRSLAPMSDPTFASHARTPGIVAAWMTFAVNEVYAVLSGFVFLRQGSAVESGPFLSVMALLVVLMGPFLVLSMAAVHAYARAPRKVYGLAALGLMLACVTITSCVNFLLFMVSASPELFAESWRALCLPVGGRHQPSSSTTSSGTGSSARQCFSLHRSSEGTGSDAPFGC